MALQFNTFNNGLKIAQYANAVFGIVLGKTSTDMVLADIASVGGGLAGYNTAVNYYYTAATTDMSGATTPAADVAAIVIGNLGVTAATVGGQTNVDAAVAFLASLISAAPGTEGAAISTFLTAWSQFTGDATYGTAATAWNATIASAQAYTASGMLDNVASTTAGALTFTLTTGQDIMTGGASNDTFIARTINNGDTLQDGDVLDGGAGTDTLYADFVPQTVAITPVLKNMETVVIRAQTIGADANGGVSTGATGAGNNMAANTVLIDAQRSLAVNDANTVTAAAGVTRWESSNSRSDVVIEDVRIGTGQKTSDVTIAFVESDPGNVDLGVYFDQLSLRNSSSSTSTIEIQLLDTRSAAADATKPLTSNPYNGFGFLLNGVPVVIQDAAGTATTAGIDGAQTYAALLTAIQTALAAAAVTNTALATVTASLGSNFTAFDTVAGTQVTGTTIVLTDTAGGTMAPHATIGWVTATGTVPATSGLHTNITAGTASSTTALVTSKVVLDDVGRGSTGGDLVIGGMSTGQTSTSNGVQRFEITVNDNSKLQTINSTNNTLREVTITSGTTSNVVADAYTTTTTNKGNLTVNGVVGVDNPLSGVEDGSAVGNHGGAGAAGFTDVRLIDATAMNGAFAFTAAVTSDSIAKYVNLVDTAASATADVATAGQTGLGANFIYTGGAGANTMAVTIDAAAAASRSTIVSGQSDFTFSINGGAAADTITVTMVPTALNGNLQNWYNNQDLNNNITITGGAGADTIRTPGAGDTTIDAGADADTVYTDNTGAQTGLNAGTGTSVTSLAAGTSSNGVWVFNTYDQANAVANGAARNIYDLRSDVNNTYNLHKATLSVSFKGIPSATITLANTTTYTTTDLEINQAIKNAINTDATLSKLLLAQDGPGASLIVTSLIDGVMSTADLTVTFASTTTEYTTAELTATNAAWGTSTVAGASVAQQAAVLLAGYTANLDYTTQMAQDAVGTNIVGAASTSTSDNFVTPGSGNDVIVLGTTESLQDVGRSSNEVVTFAAGFGSDVIVNFDAAGFGVDHLNLYAFLGTTAVSYAYAGAGVALASNATNSAISLVDEVTGTGATANNTAAQVQTLVRATAADTGVIASALSQVVIVVNTHNVGTVYSIVNGTAATDATATLQGTIDLGDTSWKTAVTLANFQVPVVSNSVATGTRTIASEGANTELVGTTLTAIVNGQTLTGTANIDTLNTGGFTGVIMTALGSGDLFVVTNGSTGTVITDLTTGDDVTVAGTGVVTAGAAAATGVSAFVASSATANNGANIAAFTINSLTAGSTISLALAGGAFGYTLVGAAGNDTLTGSALADSLNSGATGTDTLNGGAGNDALTAAGGTVTMNGGTGSNTITCAAGVDTVNTAFGGIDAIGTFAATDVITVAAGGIANVAESASWTAAATSTNAGTVTFTLAAGGVTHNAALMGGSVGTTVVGGVGVDLITGTALADTISDGGAATANSITGGAGNDTITLTSTGIDTIIGSTTAALNGSDTIATVELGAGKDIFQLNTAMVAAGLEQGGAGFVGAITAFTIADVGEAAIATKAVVYTATATTLVDTAAEIAAMIGSNGAADAGTNLAFSMVAGGKAIIFAGFGTTLYEYYVENDATAAVTAAEVTLVGTITVDAGVIDAGNFTFV